MSSAAPMSSAAAYGEVAARSDVALIDLLDRLLQGGVAIRGEIMLAAADIDLVQLDLRVVVAAIDKLAGRT